MSGPLVTLAFPCFNQARYVAEALRSLLAQTYTPLQIAISDDNSSDGTFKIIRELLQQYDGPHQVDVHRNTRRKGIENYNQLMTMARGDFIVIAHSDDLSVPERVEKLTRAWQENSVSMVSSNSVIIDAQGREQGVRLDPGKFQQPDLEWYVRRGFNPAAIGACLAWDREVFDRFGSLDSRRSAVSSDVILPFRACLLRGIFYLPDSLVYRRMHEASRSQMFLHLDNEEKLVTREAMLANRIAQFIYMFETVRTQLPDDDPRRSTLTKQLTRTIIMQAGKWAESRNRLLSKRKKNLWVDADFRDST